jgi:hypothetical protein
MARINPKPTVIGTAIKLSFKVLRREYIVSLSAKARAKFFIPTFFRLLILKPEKLVVLMYKDQINGISMVIVKKTMNGAMII